MTCYKTSENSTDLYICMYIYFSIHVYKIKKFLNNEIKFYIYEKVEKLYKIKYKV